MDLSTLVKMSNTYGSNPAYVLAGGGNTSVKNDTTLYVKGSGTQLATIKAEEFVEMSRARLNEIMKTEYPGNDTEREAAYLADVMAAVTDADKTKRPSVEALLHNLFAYTYVLHVHPTLVNGLTCGKGASALSRQLLGNEVLWIDICKPGYTLARICYEKMNAYKEEFGKDVQVLLLQNHGIFVAAKWMTEGLPWEKGTSVLIFLPAVTAMRKRTSRAPSVVKCSLAIPRASFTWVRIWSSPRIWDFRPDER